MYMYSNDESKEKNAQIVLELSSEEHNISQC